MGTSDLQAGKLIFLLCNVKELVVIWYIPKVTVSQHVPQILPVRYFVSFLSKIFLFIFCFCFFGIFRGLGRVIDVSFRMEMQSTSNVV